MQTATAILGLGNTLLGDDGIGIRVCESLEKNFSSRAHFIETEEMGLSLLDFISGYDRVLVIDGIQTGEKEPGSVTVIPIDNFSHAKHRSKHSEGLAEVAAIAQAMGVPFPREVSVIGIEVEDPYRISESLSSSIQKKWSGILEVVGLKIKEILGQEPKSYV